MKKTPLCTLFFVALSSVTYSHAAELFTEQDVINQMYTLPPKEAAYKFESLKSPSAMAWRAYLAYANIAPLEKGTPEELLLEAAAQEKIHSKGYRLSHINSTPGKISKNDLNHLQSSRNFFNLIRHVIDNGKRQYTIPCELLSRHKEDAKYAFSSVFWANMQDGHVSLCPHPPKNAASHPDVKRFLDLSFKLSNPPQRGSLWPVIARGQSEALQETFMFPLDIEAQKTRKNIPQYLAFWSTLTPYNAFQVQQYNILKESARNAIHNSLMEQHQLNKDEATLQTQVILDHLESMYIGRYSESTWQPHYESKLFKFIQQRPSTSEVQKYLKEETFKQTELLTALRHSLFNQYSDEIILTLYEQYDPQKDIQYERYTKSKDDTENKIIFYAPYSTALLKRHLQDSPNVNETNWMGKTPLMHAIQSQNIESIQLLIQAGADVNQPTYSINDIGYKYETFAREGYAGKRTPLMYAAWQGTKESIEYLIQQGADIQSRDTKGDTALSYLIRNDGIPSLQKIALIKKLSL